jgi:serine/threonine protein kinase/Tfp pilus assembly protein PilF
MEADRQMVPAASSALSQVSNPSPAPEVPDHKLLCLIGCGAYGQVWLGRNAVGRLRAVKVVHRQSFQHVDHFEREFKGLLKFEPISRSHDGLVDILQIGRRDDAGYFYYIMELADDAGRESEKQEKTDPELPYTLLPPPSSAASYTPRTLRAELHMRGSLPPADCVALGLKLTSALTYLHDNGLVHRDIKPSNIIFVNGEPKLADIGLVTAIDDAQSLVGTVGYIPPEGPGTPKADIYSMGKVLYEITFGKDRQEFPQLPPDLQSHPDYPALLELNEIILRACETDPGARYKTAHEMHCDLALLQDGKSVKQTRQRQRHWNLLKKTGLAAMTVALLVAMFALWKQSTSVHIPPAEAEREYQLGKWYYNQLTPEGHKKAMQHLKRATELDPHFMRPYRELIPLFVWERTGLFPDFAQKTRDLKQIADKLLKIDSSLAEGHTALSWWHFLQGNVREAEDEIVHSIKLDPNYPIARDIYTFYLCILGRTDEAHRQAQRSQELDPTARTSGVVAAWPFFADRQFDQAISQLQRVLELDRNFPEAHNFLARCYEAQSNYLAAVEEWKNCDLVTAQNTNRVISGYGALRQAYITDGEKGYFRKYIELIREDESLPEDDQVFFKGDIAGYYARLGEKGAALDEIEKQLDQPMVRAQLKFEPFYDTLHDEARFKKFLKRARLEN